MFKENSRNWFDIRKSLISEGARQTVLFVKNQKCSSRDLPTLNETEVTEQEVLLFF